jgi:exocyst complex component 4
MALINSLCVMLRTTPFHRENYSRLILSVIIQFYQRCSDHYRNLASQDDLGAVVGDSHLIMPARWAQKSEVSSCLSELFSTPVSLESCPQNLAINERHPSKTEDTEKIRSLCKQETRLELGFLSNGSVKKDDLIRTTRNISALSNLYHSLVCVVLFPHLVIIELIFGFRRGS